MERISNSIDVLDDLVFYSKEGKKIGIIYFDDVYLGSWDSCSCDVSIDTLDEFRKIALEDSFYLDGSDIYARGGTLVTYEDIFDDTYTCEVYGGVVLGYYWGCPVYLSSIIDREEGSAFIGSEVYLL